ncbi:MAG: YbhB/YbcL family Raf kinase inhibitor-like protein [Nanoarchaeota archaeon]
MRNYIITFIVIVALVITFSIVFFFALKSYFETNKSNNNTLNLNLKLDVQLPFKNNSLIPKTYTCDGKDINPWIKITNYKQIKEKLEKEGVDNIYLVVIVHDPDAPKDFVHWLAVIPFSNEIQEGSSQKGLYLEGKNDFGFIGYGGPCPPKNQIHHYYFEFCLVNEKPKELTYDYLQKECENAIAKTTIIGLYGR